MKKIIKNSLFLAALLSAGIMTTNAKVMTAADIDKALTFDTASNDADPAYIFGKHVYVNEYTMADATAAANTLAGQTDAVLIYKNGKNVWVNAVTKEPIDKDSFSMEMVKLIGEPANGNFVSYDSSLNAERLEQLSRSGDSRVEDVFVDENSPIQIISIRKITNLVDFTNSTESANDIYKYNMGAISVNYSANTLNLTETSPLLDYYNNTKVSNVALGDGKWVALLIRTNKALTDDVTITFGDTDLTVANMLDGKDYGAASNEFMVWVNENSFNNTLTGKSITLTYKYPEEDEKADYVQTIAVNYSKPKVIGIVKDLDSSDHKVEMQTTGSDYKIVKTGEKYTAIFYSKADTNDHNVYFAFDGYNKKIANAATSMTGLVTVTDNSFVKDTSDTNDKQDYLTVKPAVKDSTKENTYNVTIETTRKITSAKLVLDFGAGSVSGTPSKGSATSLTSVSSTDNVNDYSTTVTFANDGKATVKYSGSNGDSVTINYILIENIPAFEIESATLVSASNFKDIDNKLTNASESGAIDRLVEVNNGKLNSVNVVVGDKTNGTDELKSIINIKATDVLQGLQQSINGAIGTTKSMNYALNQKLYALVIELSNANRKDIELKNITGGNAFARGINCTTTDLVACSDSQSQYGANGDAFVVVLDSNVASLTFYNKVTQKTLEVKVNLTEVEKYVDEDLQTSDVVVSKTDGASYAGSGEFLVEENLNNFKATVNGAEYDYTCSYSISKSKNVCIKKAHLKVKAVNSVVNGVDAENVGLIYNGKSITPTLNGDDVINVNISRTMDTTYAINATQNDWFGIILEFDKALPTGLNIIGTEVKLRTGLGGLGKYLTDEQKKDVDKYALLWVHTIREDGEKTQKVGETKTHTVLLTEGSGDQTVNHVITINLTRIANSTDLKPVSARKVATDMGNSVIQGMTNLAYNQAAIQKIEVVDGIIKIHVNKSIAKTGFKPVTITGITDDNLTTSKRYIAILANLNSNTSIGDTRYSTYAKDNFDAKENETLIWLEMPANASDSRYAGYVADPWNEDENVYCYELEFTNNNPENNKNDEKIKIEVIDESKDLTLSVSQLAANSIPKEYKDVDGKLVEFNALVDDTSVAGYKFNQNNFAGFYTTTDTANTLTINPLKANTDALFYNRMKNDGNPVGANYIAFRIDFGTDVTRVDSSKAGIGFEKSDGTSYILYVAVNNNDIKSSSGTTYQFKSTYDESQTFTLTVKYDSTVKAN